MNRKLREVSKKEAGVSSRLRKMRDEFSVDEGRLSINFISVRLKDCEDVIVSSKMAPPSPLSLFSPFHSTSTLLTLPPPTLTAAMSVRQYSRDELIRI